MRRSVGNVSRCRFITCGRRRGPRSTERRAFVVRKELPLPGPGPTDGELPKGHSYWHIDDDGDFAAEHDCSSESVDVSSAPVVLPRVVANVSADVAETSDFENTFITITPAVMRPIPTNAGVSSVCLAQTQATSVMRTIANPDQMAYTMPVGIVRSGNARSQNAATKQKPGRVPRFCASCRRAATSPI